MTQTPVDAYHCIGYNLVKGNILTIIKKFVSPAGRVEIDHRLATFPYPRLVPSMRFAAVSDKLGTSFGMTLYLVFTFFVPYLLRGIVPVEVIVAWRKIVGLIERVFVPAMPQKEVDSMSPYIK